MLKPKLFSIIKHRKTELTKKQVINDIISGIIVAIIALPLSIALAIASGVSPEKGLITAIIASFFISFLGGSRVQIGGPTGAFVIIVYGVIQDYGMNGLIIATIIAGVFTILFGFIRLGNIIQFVPYPITTGFTAGIAIVLLSTQVKDFFGLSIKNVPSEFIPKWGSYFSNFSTIHIATTLIGILALLIIIFWPKINKTIPGSLIALVITTILVKIFDLPVETIGSRFGEISAHISLISFSDLNFNFSDLKELLHPAITIAILASIESLLSAVVADGMIGKKHNSNMELIALGLANIASALFGGIPATGAIARTAANIKNGARTPIAGIVHSIVLFLIMILFMPLAKLIPMTTLSAILIIVAYNMSEWRSFKNLLKSTKSDSAILLATFSLTVLFDLVVAIEIGMIVAMLLFVKRMAENTQITKANGFYESLVDDDTDEIELTSESSIRDTLNKQVLLYEINGPLFFGSTNRFIDVISEINYKKSVLILKMKNVSSMDATALNSLKRIDALCKEKHILILYSELNEQPLKLLNNSGFVTKIGQDRFFTQTNDAISVANSILDRCKHTNS